MSHLTDCLDAASLRALVELRATPAVAERMESLAMRASEGLLTPVERTEYESCILFANFLGVMQSKARRKLGVI